MIVRFPDSDGKPDGFRRPCRAPGPLHFTSEDSSDRRRRRLLALSTDPRFPLDGDVPLPGNDHRLIRIDVTVPSVE